MAEVARLVGIEERDYTGSDGQQRHYCGLHMEYVENSVRGVRGSKVETMSCPREVSSRSLELGGLYQLEYEMYNTRNGKQARLVDLLPVEE